jgi:3-phosphoshikimate 1-carboxyvinyltransferase
MNYFYKGKISSSKSIYNRLLIVQQYYPQIYLEASTASEDVLNLISSLSTLKKGESSFNIGEGGTTFRFFAFFLSRKRGVFHLKMKGNLKSRPHEELIEVLSRLGTKTEWVEDGCTLYCQGWPEKLDEIEIKATRTSQNLTGLLLNSLDLKSRFTIHVKDKIESFSYFEMTLQLLKKIGFKIELLADNSSHIKIVIDPQFSIAEQTVYVEPDISSVFSVAAAAALKGDLCIQGLPNFSLQPDARFLDLFRSMNVNFSVTNYKDHYELSVHTSDQLRPIQVDLSQTPDLFPVLSVLCAHISGKSVLYGARQLKFKESNRITSVINILKQMGISYQESDDGLTLYGNPKVDINKTILVETFKDHRIAMAAGLLIHIGWSVQIDEASVVNKSFPEFWDILGQKWVTHP